VEFRLLGLLQVNDGGRAIALPRGKERALLAVLLLHANEPVSTDRLVDALWGERPPEHATKTVQVYVSRLRKSVGGDRLTTTPVGYLLTVGDGELDVGQFERLAAEGRRVLDDGDAARAERLLSEGLALWRGPALADFRFDDFAQPESRRLDELRADAAADRVDARLECGRARAVIGELEQLVAENPLEERPHRQLMLALYRAGRQAEALAVYRRTRALLADELGLEPSPQLQALERAILNHDPVLDAPASPLRRARTRRGGRLLLAGGVLVLAAAAVAAVLLIPGGHSGLRTLAPNSLGVIDAATRQIVAQIPVPVGPARLASAGPRVWVGSDDSRTVSVVDASTRRATKLVTTGFPSELAVGEGAAWVVDGPSGLLRKIDPTYGVVGQARITPPNLAYDGSRGYLDPLSVAAGLGSVWVADGSRRLIRVDPATAKPASQVDLGARLDGVAVGLDAVWAISGADASLIRLNSRGRKTARIPIVSRPGFQSPFPLAVAVGEGYVWVLNGNTATVTKIDPKQRGVYATIPIGIEHGPLRLTAGAGAAWVADEDGTLARIDPVSNHLEIIPIAHGLKDVAVASGSVWVTTGAGLSNASTSTNVDTGRVQALPTTSCSPIYHGAASPRFLIAADLPLQGLERTVSAQASQAVLYTLRQHGFHAGRYAVGYQICDDSTSPRGYWSPRRCAANAHAYASDANVIGVIGAFNSGCSQIELPITNRAPAGPLAMISPQSTYVGLTHSGPGTAPDEPGRYYPTGARNYVRLTPADDVQATADALLAKRLSIRRVYVLEDRSSPYTSGIAADFRSAAARLGIKVVGSDVVDEQQPPFGSRIRRIRAAAPNAVFLALYGPDPDSGRLIRDLHAGLGARIRLMAPDSFTDFGELVRDAGAAAEGMTVSVSGLPNERLPARGKAFVAAFSRTVGETPTQFSAYWAQAAEVLLDAVGRSEGTRASVTAQLFKTNVKNGILGSFSIDANGDTTAGSVTIYRIAQGRPTVFDVITPGRRSHPSHALRVHP
jgi:DNA-binding SARP family transcriptional activator/ABC-type branched-subunit amino acid transport system substrate-binding protein/DNA-binding beta-propeller fold protein YncE